ncbi:MAG: hypothetical protein AMS24_04845 [Chlamydiae bacterium SM23_39]|nr:MAG: hypothetical protein AMS24_04845 [Chlamydiae bacterium SM23_39]
MSIDPCNFHTKKDNSIQHLTNRVDELNEKVEKIQQTISEGQFSQERKKRFSENKIVMKIKENVFQILEIKILMIVLKKKRISHEIGKRLKENF